MQNHKNRHRRWAALLGFDSGQRLMYPCAKPSEHHKGIIIYLSEQHIKTYCRKYTLSTHWKAKIQRFNSCFRHVTTLRSGSTHTGLISSKVLVHLTGFYVLHKPSRAECCPVNGNKRSASKLVFSSSIRFQPKTKEPTVPGWGHPGTAWPPPVRAVIVARCRFTRKSFFFLLQTFPSRCQNISGSSCMCE